MASATQGTVIFDFAGTVVIAYFHILISCNSIREFRVVPVVTVNPAGTVIHSTCRSLRAVVHDDAN